MRQPKAKASGEASQSSSFIPIVVYQRYISPIDGERCPMHPSCSQYTAQSIDKFGMLRGVLMGTDRIMRCGNDAKTYPIIWGAYRHYYLDPPELSHIHK